MQDLLVLGSAFKCHLPVAIPPSWQKHEQYGYLRCHSTHTIECQHSDTYCGATTSSIRSFRVPQTYTGRSVPDECSRNTSGLASCTRTEGVHNTDLTAEHSSKNTKCQTFEEKIQVHILYVKGVGFLGEFAYKSRPLPSAYPPVCQSLWRLTFT